jgi:hypothetical protein
MRLLVFLIFVAVIVIIVKSILKLIRRKVDERQPWTLAQEESGDCLQYRLVAKKPGHARALTPWLWVKDYGEPDQMLVRDHAYEQVLVMNGDKELGA